MGQNDLMTFDDVLVDMDSPGSSQSPGPAQTETTGA